MPKINNHRLDKIDKKILSAIETDARMPISEISRKAAVSRTVAEYRLKQFEEKEIVRGHYCLLDPSQFGFTVWKLWISVKNKKTFFEYVKNHPKIWWYAECAGVYDAVLCVICRSPHDFNNFFRETQSHGNITDASTLINVSFEYHTRGWISGKRSRMIGTSFQESPLTKKISKTAIEILKILSRNSRISYSEIAEKTGRNTKTVKSTIKYLKESGIIVYFRPSIDVEKIGYEYYKVLLYLHNPKQTLSVIQWCRENKNVMAIISCVGPWQLELEVEIDTYRNLCVLLADMKEKFQDSIKRYETLLIVREGNYDLDLIDKLIKMREV